MYYNPNVTHTKIRFVTNTTTNEPIKYKYIPKYEDRIPSVHRRVREKPE